MLKEAHIPFFLTCLQFGADMDPDPAYHFDADPDPDPAYQFDADPDPDPSFRFDADQCGSGSATFLSTSLPETLPSWTEFFAVSLKAGS